MRKTGLWQNIFGILVMVACIALGIFFFVCAYQVGRNDIRIGYLIFLGIFSIAASPVLGILASEGGQTGHGDYKGPGGAYGGGSGSDRNNDADADYDLD